MWQFSQHQRLREQGIPRVSVFTSGIVADKAWADWLNQRDSVELTVVHTSEHMLAQEFFDTVSADGRLIAAVHALIRQTLQLTAAKLKTWLKHATREQIMHALIRALPRGDQRSMREICAATLMSEPLAVKGLEAAAAVSALLPEQTCALRVRNVGTLEQVRVLHAFSLACPSVPCAISAPEAALQQLLAHAESTPLHPWLSDGWMYSGQVDVEPHASNGQALSQPERVLWNALQNNGETQGVFQPLSQLDIKFGNKRMVVDLLAQDLRVVIEVDGAYHFMNNQAYRTDRRKDLLLQLLGYTVVRVLAPDVLDNLPAVMEIVLHAVRQKREKAYDPYGLGAK